MVAGKPLEKDAVYRIVTKVGDLTNGQSAPFTEYYTAHPEALPPKGNYLNIHSLLMSYFARNLWHRMWENIHADDEDGVLDALDGGATAPSASRRSTRRSRASWACRRTARRWPSRDTCTASPT